MPTAGNGQPFCMSVAHVVVVWVAFRCESVDPHLRLAVVVRQRHRCRVRTPAARALAARDQRTFDLRRDVRRRPHIGAIEQDPTGTRGVDVGRIVRTHQLSGLVRRERIRRLSDLLSNSVEQTRIARSIRVRVVRPNSHAANAKRTCARAGGCSNVGLQPRTVRFCSRVGRGGFHNGSGENDRARRCQRRIMGP